MMGAIAFPQPSERWAFTVKVAARIRRTGYRFDKSWRHGETEWKARFYERCHTVAANDIADDPGMARFWRNYI